MAKLPFKDLTHDSINSMLAWVNLKVTRRSGEFDEFIPLQATLRGAREAGLSVGDYIDAKYNVPGATQETIDLMGKLGTFDNHPQHVCEIGPGSGRYLDKVKLMTNPQHYEIYETSVAWRKYLVDTYGVVARYTDGKTLTETPTASIDLLHSHKVFEGLPIFTTFRYFSEVARVVKVGGKAAFDVISEECLDDATIERWLQIWEPYAKSMVPKQLAIEFFGKRGFQFDGAFKIVMAPGFTEYLVFTRVAAGS